MKSVLKAIAMGAALVILYAIAVSVVFADSIPWGLK